MRKTVRKNKANNNDRNTRATRKKTVGGSLSRTGSTFSTASTASTNSNATYYDPLTLEQSPLFNENNRLPDYSSNANSPPIYNVAAPNPVRPKKFGNIGTIEKKRQMIQELKRKLGLDDISQDENIYEEPVKLDPNNKSEDNSDSKNDASIDMPVYTDDYLKQQIISFIPTLTHKGGKYLLCYYMFHNINKYKLTHIINVGGSNSNEFGRDAGKYSLKRIYNLPVFTDFDPKAKGDKTLSKTVITLDTLDYNTLLNNQSKLDYSTGSDYMAETSKSLLLNYYPFSFNDNKYDDVFEENFIRLFYYLIDNKTDADDHKDYFKFMDFSDGVISDILSLYNDPLVDCNFKTFIEVINNPNKYKNLDSNSIQVIRETFIKYFCLDNNSKIKPIEYFFKLKTKFYKRLEEEFKLNNETSPYLNLLLFIQAFKKSNRSFFKNSDIDIGYKMYLRKLVLKNEIKLVYFKDEEEKEQLNFDRLITADELINLSVNKNKSPDTEYHHYRIVSRKFRSLPLCEEGVCEKFKDQTTDISKENLNMGKTSDRNAFDYELKKIMNKLEFFNRETKENYRAEIKDYIDVVDNGFRKDSILKAHNIMFMEEYFPNIIGIGLINVLRKQYEQYYNNKIRELQYNFKEKNGISDEFFILEESETALKDINLNDTIINLNKPIDKKIDDLFDPYIGSQSFSDDQNVKGSSNNEILELLKKYIGVTNLLTKQQEEKRNNLKIPYDKLIEQTQIMLDEDIQKLKFTDNDLKTTLRDILLSMIKNNQQLDTTKKIVIIRLFLKNQLKFDNATSTKFLDENFSDVEGPLVIRELEKLKQQLQDLNNSSLSGGKKKSKRKSPKRDKLKRIGKAIKRGFKFTKKKRKEQKDEDYSDLYDDKYYFIEDSEDKLKIQDNMIIHDKNRDIFYTLRKYLIPPIFNQEYYMCNESNNIIKNNYVNTVCERNKDRFPNMFRSKYYGNVDALRCVNVAQMGFTGDDKVIESKKIEDDDFTRVRGRKGVMTRCVNTHKYDLPLDVTKIPKGKLGILKKNYQFWTLGKDYGFFEMINSPFTQVLLHRFDAIPNKLSEGKFTNMTKREIIDNPSEWRKEYITKLDEPTQKYLKIVNYVREFSDIYFEKEIFGKFMADKLAVSSEFKFPNKTITESDRCNPTVLIETLMTHMENYFIERNLVLKEFNNRGFKKEQPKPKTQPNSTSEKGVGTETGTGNLQRNRPLRLTKRKDNSTRTPNDPDFPIIAGLEASEDKLTNNPPEGFTSEDVTELFRAVIPAVEDGLPGIPGKTGPEGPRGPEGKAGEVDMDALERLIAEKVKEEVEKISAKKSPEAPSIPEVKVIEFQNYTVRDIIENVETEASKAKRCYADVLSALKKVEKSNLLDLQGVTNREAMLDSKLVGLSPLELKNIKDCFKDKPDYSATFNDVLNRVIDENPLNN